MHPIYLGRVMHGTEKRVLRAAAKVAYLTMEALS